MRFVKLSKDKSWGKTLKFPEKRSLPPCWNHVFLGLLAKSTSVSLTSTRESGTTCTATDGLDCVLLIVIISFLTLDTRSYCSYTSNLKTNMPAIFANTHVRTFVLIWPALLTVIGESGLQLSSPEPFVTGFPVEGVSF